MLMNKQKKLVVGSLERNSEDNWRSDTISKRDLNETIKKIKKIIFKSNWGSSKLGYSY